MHRPRGGRPLAATAALAALLMSPALPACADPPLADLASWPTPAAPGSGEPGLAVASDGTTFLSWFEKVDSTRHVLKVSRLVREQWAPAATVAEGDSFFVNWADTPALLALGGKKLMIAWPWKSGGDPYAYDVRIAGSGDGGRTWTPPIVPHRDGTRTEHGFVSLVSAGGGKARAFWLDGRKFADLDPHQGEGGEHGEGKGEMTLRSARIAVDGTLDEEVEVDDRVCDCCPTSAAGHGGSVVVAYRDRSAGEIRDISVAWLEGGRWSEPAPVHLDGWHTPGCPVNGPALDRAGDRLVVAWFTMAGDSARVLVAFSNDHGRDFGAPLRVDGGDPVGRVGALMLGDGSALVSWVESREKEALIQVRRTWPSGQLSEPFTVARTSPARASGFPRMARSGRRVFFAWTEAGERSQVRVASARIP